MEKSNLYKSRLARAARSAKAAQRRKRDDRGKFIPIHPFFKKENPNLDDLIQSTYIDDLG